MWRLCEASGTRCTTTTLAAHTPLCMCGMRIRMWMRVRMRKASQRRRVKLQAHMCSEFNLFRQHGERMPTTCKTISSPSPPSSIVTPLYQLFSFFWRQTIHLASPGSCTCSCNLPDSRVRKGNGNGRGIRTQNNVLNAENEIQASTQTLP